MFYEISSHHGTRNSTGFGSGVDAFTKLEGVTITDEHREDFYEAIRRQDVERAIDTMFTVAEQASRPVDAIARYSTDASLRLLEAARQIDPEGNHIKLTQWEQFYRERQLVRGESPSLRGINQKNALRMWLIDSIFPLDAIEEADKLFPKAADKKGFAESWMKHLGYVADDLVYAPLREVLSSSIDAGTVSAISVLPKEWQYAASFGQMLAGVLISAVSDKTDQRLNYFWGVTKDLAVDLRTVTKRFGRRYESQINYDTIVSEITQGGIQELQYRLKTYGIWSMVSGIGAANLIVRSKLYGFPKAAMDTAVIVGSGIAAIRLSEQKDVRLGFEVLSEEFGKQMQAINHEAMEHEAEASVSGALVGDKLSIETNAHKRNWLTFRKNLPTSLLIGSVPQFMIALAAAASHNNWTSVSVSMGPTIQRALDRLGSYMSYRSSQHTRMASRKTLVSLLRTLHHEVYGTRSDELLRGWTQPEPVDWNGLDQTLSFRSVGLVPFRRASDGEEIETMKFEDGFDVPKNAIVPIYGGNGSGKSNYISVVSGESAGVLDNTDIRLGGVDTRLMSAEQYKRSFAIVRSKEGDTLRQLLAQALLYKGQLRQHRLGLEIDIDRMLLWSRGKAEYPELERAVDVYMKKWDVKVHAVIPWHDATLRPSGMQRAMSNILFYMLVTEPVRLFIDEVGSEFDTQWTKQYISFLTDRVAHNETPGQLFVCVNKDDDLWWNLKGTFYIDMRQPVQGKVRFAESNAVESPLPEDMRHMIAERLGRKYEMGIPMDPGELIQWMDNGPGYELDMRIKQLLEDYGGRFTGVSWTELSGALAFEKQYTPHIEVCIQEWVKEYTRLLQTPVSGRAERINDYVIRMLQGVLSVYGRERRFQDYHRRSRPEFTAIGDHRWSEDLVEAPFYNMINSVILDHMRKIERTKFYIESQSKYPSGYERRTELLRSYAVIELFESFFRTYADLGWGSATYFDHIHRSLIENHVLSFPHHVKRTSMRTKEPRMADLQKILADPSVLYSLSTGNLWHANEFMTFMNAILMNIFKPDDLEKLRGQMREKIFPLCRINNIETVSFWDQFNASHQEKGIGLLVSAFDRRRGQLLQTT